MVRPNFPDTMRDARSVRAGIILGIMDLVMLAIVFLWLVFVCGGGSLPSTADPDTRLTLFHLAHLVLAVPAILLFALSVLFLPVWFAGLGMVVFFVDVFVLVVRLGLLATAPNLFCTLFMLLFDVVFLLLALMYIGFGVTAVSRFGLFGSRDAVTTAYALPRENFAAPAPATPGPGPAAAAPAGVPGVFLPAGPRQGSVSF